ncbi:MAG: TetR/AcrR family transcriptional regulator [Microthrixaceae bacterium]
MRRAPKLDLAPILGALAEPTEDETTTRILDATVEVLVVGGLRRCTVEEIAETAGVGRTTIYRRFDGRERLVHAVLARELRSLFDAVTASVQHLDAVQDQVADGFLSVIEAAHRSPVVSLLRSEPDLLMFLISDAGPVLDLVTGLMAEQLRISVRRAGGGEIDLVAARHGAEIVFRLAVSFVLMPSSSLPLLDRDAASAAVHQLFDPLLAPFLGAPIAVGGDS